ncbi:GIY-YIG nuclease family protein [Shewanella baltica]|uniref:GIY-YIG nuclease family protein n=1 Tax=Shewanella baltica TaxID=62322 RepID=UPI00217D6FD1|nr:GIY-YIG nuclease family protein [Shewanella baltica]MCS6128952.1 GIY-YIG nuclease family protein [Shewanella baltica]MCS6140882.1 GIY-YIG nuclease family protein [Shewanella baltica]MCS6147166.1 GIY-YIG nuclease family protein [Shewanella baltica]MCS6171715.1 GIY-YIG nuclease family protein [Shewanella baltica]MCS6188920.1 GIY-YIG nuclease family protein [Shewanella baltica]
MTESAVSLGNTDIEAVQQHESLMADTLAPVTSAVATKNVVTEASLNPVPLNPAPLRPTPIKSSSLWYLYLVRCANGHLYTGVTTNVARRFSEHQSGGIKSAKYLRGKGPLTLMYQEQVGCHGDALRREIAVKKLSRSQKLALIESAEYR